MSRQVEEDMKGLISIILIVFLLCMMFLTIGALKSVYDMSDILIETNKILRERL